MPKIINANCRSVPRHISRVHCSGFVAGNFRLWKSLFCNFPFILLICDAFSRAEGRPMQNLSEARWINPCDLPGHLFDPKYDMVDAPKANHLEITQNIVARIKTSRDQATDILESYVKYAFKDPSFVEGIASHRLSWLPKVSREKVKNMTLAELCTYSFEVLQYYAVGMDQVLLDEVMYGGRFLTQCRDAENLLTQLLCQVHMATFLLKSPPTFDVTRAVMHQKLRQGNYALRMYRNYLIFRDYVETLNIILEAFEAIEARTLSPLTTPQPVLYQN
ncbi:uncharacterized protein TNIN_83761 [Trichonephila inaurata madagascariensis]|uniref:Uncharacterized protein n=1 Tax=Trichonephila inaurata madagascariensis TaxID=2747483 RepID=A0A8X6XX40_9ARAC|nr:uncharacterized protein TNIN_83761 [Trichonephila inaurata madagascariensis]